MTEKQQADAEVVYALAAAVDLVRALGKNLSSLAANSRALAVHVKEFRERSGVVPSVIVDAPAPSSVDSPDEVARKRAERRNLGRQTG